MNKQERFNKLRWKYFWKQKFKEIGKVITIIMAIAGGGFFLPYFIGKVMYLLFPEALTMTDLSSFWITGFMVIMFICVIGGVIFKIIEGIIHWLKNNMKEAEKKAWKELK